VVAKRRSRFPELSAFGAYLRKLRGDRSREQISIRLRDLGVPLDESTLVQYEKGTVWSPDVGVLWGLSRIYQVSIATLVSLLRENRARPQVESKDWPELLRASREPESVMATLTAGLWEFREWGNTQVAELRTQPQSKERDEGIRQIELLVLSQVERLGRGLRQLMDAHIGHDDSAGDAELTEKATVMLEHSERIQRALESDSEHLLKLVDLWPDLAGRHRVMLVTSANEYSRVSPDGGQSSVGGSARSGVRTPRPQKAKAISPRGASRGKAESA
jgi:transcriptional regulator with XRE-family HTH domain